MAHNLALFLVGFSVPGKLIGKENVDKILVGKCETLKVGTKCYLRALQVSEHKTKFKKKIITDGAAA